MWSEGTPHRINERKSGPQERRNNTKHNTHIKKEKTESAHPQNTAIHPFQKPRLSPDQAIVAMATPFQVTRRKRNQGKRTVSERQTILKQCCRASQPGVTPRRVRTDLCCVLFGIEKSDAGCFLFCHPCSKICGLK
ncbi:hypothetical protein TNIN_316471 [Trichonephila inaurata madagascariensis]|uniref:Uncharacterized protein n=1 Tax=Trichonephila inaurata madagascariensis TaxID=2747483 RepID=A0A8X6IX98_9ARAC|nr:hypothetical protein TNIN_316471 [Trichonephila inaurata madagascariensis]